MPEQLAPVYCLPPWHPVQMTSFVRLHKDTSIFPESQTKNVEKNSTIAASPRKIDIHDFTFMRKL